MKKKILFLLTGVILLAGLLYAKKDVTMQLSTSDGSSVVSFKNSNGIVVSSVTSTGEVFVNTFSVRASTFVVKNGNVGIGTANPSKKLDINGDINFNGTLYQNNSAYVGSQWETTGSNISYDSGNVGIGTTSPTGKLHVYGGGVNHWELKISTYTTAMGYNITSSGSASTAMGYNTTAQAYISVVLGQYNVVSGSTNTWVATDPLFVIGNGSGIGASSSNAMTVLKNGNIGIGTTTPIEVLEIAGNIKATAGIIASTGVFSGNVDISSITFNDGTIMYSTSTFGGSTGDYVDKTGDTMTGDLNLPSLNATYGISAATGVFSAEVSVGTLTVVGVTNKSILYTGISSSGTITLETDVWTSCGGTWDEEQDPQDDWTISGSSFTYTGTATRLFSIVAMASGESAVNATFASFAVFLNNVIESKSEQKYSMLNSENQAADIQSLVSMSTNDVIDLRCKTDDGDDLIANNMTVIIRQEN